MTASEKTAENFLTMNKIIEISAAALAFLAMQVPVLAQQYPDGLIDKTVAVVGNEMISISQLEE